MPTNPSRALLALLATVVAGLVGAGAAGEALAQPGGDVVVIEGRGHGHGVGMSQWGAEAMAREGRSTYEILGTFYPGTSLALASADVRVVVHHAGGAVTLAFPDGGTVRSHPGGQQAPGYPVRVDPGGRVRVEAGPAGYRAVPVSGAHAGPGAEGAPVATHGPLWAVPADGGATTVVERGRTYRGLLEVGGEGGFRVVNRVDVETYLKGMAEVPASWPAAAQEAQAIAARTYGLRAIVTSGEICDDQRCQVYVGTSAEHPAQSAAVDATRGQVLTYGGGLISAVYSADAGGTTATTLEGFGTPDGVYPYLRAVPYAPDRASDPRAWRVEVGLGTVAARFGYPGRLHGVRVATVGPSGRALEVELVGDAGARRVDGRRFSSALGLRSTLFTLGGPGATGGPDTAVAALDAPPPPPPTDAPPPAPEPEPATDPDPPEPATAAAVEHALPDDAGAAVPLPDAPGGRGPTGRDRALLANPVPLPTTITSYAADPGGIELREVLPAMVAAAAVAVLATTLAGTPEARRAAHRLRWSRRGASEARRVTLRPWTARSLQAALAGSRRR